MWNSLALALSLALSQQAPPAEKLPLQVLYASNPGTPYSAAWESFLGEHSARVHRVAGASLRAEDLAGFDLLVVDGEVETHDAAGELHLKNQRLKLALEDLQGFPVVLMGGQGGFFSDDLKLKTSWHAG